MNEKDEMTFDEAKQKAASWAIMAGGRAARTVCQTLLSMIGTAAVFSDVDWKYTITASLFAGFISLLMSVVSLPEYKISLNDDGVDIEESDRCDAEAIDYTDDSESKEGEGNV